MPWIRVDCQVNKTVLLDFEVGAVVMCAASNRDVGASRAGCRTLPPDRRRSAAVQWLPAVSTGRPPHLPAARTGLQITAAPFGKRTRYSPGKRGSGHR
jgi:hypothetical protein